MTTPGYQEGDICNRNGCGGVMILDLHVENCSCHISPPCNACMENEPICDECGQSANDGYQVSMSQPFTPKKYVYDFETGKPYPAGLWKRMRQEEKRWHKAIRYPSRNKRRGITAECPF